ncbi:MAG: Hpt domain-containing protein [Planctomycetota bacterium]
MAFDRNDPASRTLDLAGVLERLEGDIELLKELLSMFFDFCPDQLAEIRSALDRSDAGALARAAHCLKGAAGNVGAAAAFELCRRLETMGREAVLDAALATFQELEIELTALRTEAVEKGLAGHT